MQTDPIADMLTRIRNGYLAKKSHCEVPYSRIKEEIGQLLEREHFLEKVTVAGEGKEKHLSLQLRYETGQPAVTKVRRISKPGRRVYSSSQELPRVLSGLGMAIVTTAKGVMTVREAKKQNLGGEVICYVW